MPRGLPTIIFFLLIVAGLSVMGWWMSRTEIPQANGAATILPPTTNPANVVVMAANIHLDAPNDGNNAWAKRRDLVVKTFLKYQPDIIACQEVSPSQGAFLYKELIQWYSYYPRAGVGATGAATPGAGVLGLITDSLASLNTTYYRKDRFDLIDGEAGLVIPEEPQATATENTYFSLAVLRQKPEDKGRHLIVVNMHFRHGEAFAAKCATRIRDKLGIWSTRYPGAGLVVLGDMNRGLGSAMYQILTARGPAGGPPVTDMFDNSLNVPPGKLGTYHQFRGRSVNNGPTDLIFYGGGLTPEAPSVVVQDHEESRWPSDHFFVLGTLKFPEKSE